MAITDYFLRSAIFNYTVQLCSHLLSALPIALNFRATLNHFEMREECEAAGT